MIKDNGIGVGLFCSKFIANAIDGDVDFVPNEKDQAMVKVDLKVKLYDQGRRGSDCSVKSIANFSEFRSYKKSGIGQDLVTAKILHSHKKARRMSSDLSMLHQNISSGNESPNSIP